MRLDHKSADRFRPDLMWGKPSQPRHLTGVATRSGRSGGNISDLAGNNMKPSEDGSDVLVQDALMIWQMLIAVYLLSQRRIMCGTFH